MDGELVAVVIRERFAGRTEKFVRQAGQVVGDVEFLADFDYDLNASVKHFGVAGEVFVDDRFDRGVDFGAGGFRFG